MLIEGMEIMGCYTNGMAGIKAKKAT
jgi:hypothetical protein